jgi:hypothetical protein
MSAFFQMIQLFMVKRVGFWILDLDSVYPYKVFFIFASRPQTYFLPLFTGTLCHSHLSWHAKAVEGATLVRKKGNGTENTGVNNFAQTQVILRVSGSKYGEGS